MKKLALALALCVALPAHAVPPVQLCNDSGVCVPFSATTGIPVTTLPNGATRWTCSLSNLAATLTECQALAAARVYYITDIVVGTTTATPGDYSIQSGTGANCVTATTAVWPASATTARFKAPIAANPVAVISLSQPVVVTAAHAVCVIGTVTQTINIQIVGYYL